MLINLTKKTVVSLKIKELNGLSKTLGLLGKYEPEAVVMHTRFGIHTFFLKFPIDILILNNNNKVVFLKSGLKPNNLFLWDVRYNIVLELADKSIKNSKTEIGDILEINL